MSRVVDVYTLHKECRALTGSFVQFLRVPKAPELVRNVIGGPDDLVIAYDEAPVHMLVDPKGRTHYVAMDPELRQMLEVPLKARADAADLARDFAERELARHQARIAEWGRLPLLRRLVLAWKKELP